MYKKLILATAIAAVAGQASAASWVTSNFGDQVAVKHTLEGIDKVTEADGVVTSGAIVSLGAAFAPNDTITFTYNTAKATNANWPTNVYSRKAGSTPDVTALFDEASHIANDPILDVDVGGTDDSANFAVGDICNFAGANSAVDYRVLTVNTSTEDIVVSPHPLAIADNSAVTCDDPSFLALGLISSTSTSVTYRVTSKTEGASTVGAEIAVPSPNVSVAALKASKSVTVAFSAATASGTAMDTLATTASLGTAVDEIKYTVTEKFNGVIDVENDKKIFSSNYVTSNTDAGSATLTAVLTGGVAGDKHTIASSGAVTIAANVDDVMTAAQGAVTTITGDFTYLDDATTAGITATGMSATNTASVAMATTGASWTGTDTTVQSEALVFTVDNSEAAVMTPQSFTGSTVVTYTSAGIATATKTINHGSLGSWTLNGASVTAYAVPMGEAVSRFLWVSNGGAGSAVASYTVTMNGSAYGPYALATIPGKTSMSVSGLIDNDLAARGVYIAPSSRANIQVTAPVKANDVTISASYKHIGDSDRLGLETSDSLTALDGK